ncbi:tunicamycin resistance protein [Sorochytrium milnesiophthora]
MADLVWQQHVPVHALTVCVLVSLAAALLTAIMIPRVGPLFIKAGLSGADLAKANRRVIPEAMGMVCGLVYLIALFLFMPFAFLEYKWHPTATSSDDNTGLMLALRLLPKEKFTSFLSGLLSILSMLFLGFADDVLDIRWRHKLFLPAIASLPLLIVYGIESGVTWIVLPKPLDAYFGTLLNLGPLYYAYMCLVAIFCTNSINILAGVNGVEAGQSLMIALSILANSLYCLMHTTNPKTIETHLVSVYLTLPFIGVTAALLFWNWYPSRVFVGDTFTYFAGMVFAVIGIQGHFSKTLLLFFLPQVFNFVYSTPQLFRLLPCPRHRLPHYNVATDRLDPSMTTVARSRLSLPGQLVLLVFGKMGLVHVEYRTISAQEASELVGTPASGKSSAITSKDTSVRSRPNKLQSTTQASPAAVKVVSFNNLTILNLLIVWRNRWCGDTKGLAEPHVTLAAMGCQALGSVVAFLIRYGAVSLFYDLPMV